MKISDKGLAIIKKYEGCRLTAYKCPAGKWTIGYGHTSGVKAGQTITRAQADTYLKQDVAWAEKAVNALKRGFNQNQFDALVSFTFNCGTGNLKKLCSGRDIETIGKKIVIYNKAGGKVLGGLTKRRLEEQELYQTPVQSVQASAVQNTQTSMPTIRKGDRGDAVKKMQNALLAQKYKTCTIGGKKKKLKADGDWGDITESIFRRWQGAMGLKVDGVCGPKSWAKLGY